MIIYSTAKYNSFTVKNGDIYLENKVLKGYSKRLADNEIITMSIFTLKNIIRDMKQKWMK